MSMYLDVEVYLNPNQENSYVAACPELEIYSYAESAPKAIERLEAILKFYMTHAPEYGITREKLQEMSVDKQKYPEYYLPGREARGVFN